MKRKTLFSYWLLLVVMSLLLSGIVIAGTQAQQAALEVLQSEYSSVNAYKVDGRVIQLYGGSFGGGSGPVNAAETFARRHAAVFGANPRDLKPQSLLADSRHTQPLVWDPETQSYKFTLVYYSQHRNNVPVFRSEMRVLVRNEPGFPIVLATSTLKDLDGFQAQDKIAVRFDLSKSIALSEVPGLTDFSEPETMVWSGDDGVIENPRMALVFEGSSENQRWLFVTDAVSGEVLFKENQVIFEDVVGNVSGMATEGWAAEQCGEEVLTPLPYAAVNIASTVTYADENGDFVIPHEGSSQVIVSSMVSGQYFVATNMAGESSIQTRSVVPPGPADFTHNEINTELVRAEVNGYVQANKVRNKALQYNPAYPTVSTQTEFPIYVNRSDGYCPGNAWYNGYSINFCRSGDGYPNTAFATVVHHEYGHHLVGMAGSGQDQYGEGMADVMAILITDDPGLGYGFYGEGYCDYSLRTADNTMQYPCNGESHYCGKLMSGSVWSIRNELAASYPGTYRDILGNLAVNAMLLHTGSQITPQIVIDYLTLDDDDANIANGTPHYQEICAGFAAHNMICPEIQYISFAYPEGIPQHTAPDVETTFLMTVEAQAAAPIESSAMLYYSIDGAPDQSLVLSELSPNTYEVVLPAVSCDSRVDWYVTAEASGEGAFSDPPDAPTARYGSSPVTMMERRFDDNFETDLGWAVSSSVSSGVWERGVPVGGGDRGDPPTDFDGSGQCYLTENEDGASDVGYGYTLVMSPIFDLENGDGILSYARWYSNDNAAGTPGEDVMTVSLSSNGGSSWTTVETVGPAEQASGGWYAKEFIVSDFVTPTSTVRARFMVSDYGNESVVEAGIDAFAIDFFDCYVYVCGDGNGSGDVDIDDVVFIVQYIFSGGSAPYPLESADADCSGDVDIDDVVYLIAYVFSGGPAPCDTNGDGQPEC